MGSALCHEMFTWSSKLPSVMLKSNFSVYFRYTVAFWLFFRLLFAVCLVVYLNKHNIDNDVCVSLSWILLTHFCVAVMLICITHSRDQPPLKSTLFQLKVYANIWPIKISKWERCFQLF